MNKRQKKKAFKKRYGDNPYKLAIKIKIEVLRAAKEICKETAKILDDAGLLQQNVESMKNTQEETAARLRNIRRQEDLLDKEIKKTQKEEQKWRST